MTDQYLYDAPLTHVDGSAVLDSDGQQMTTRWRIVDRVIYGADAEVAVWVAERLGGGLVTQQIKSVGILAAGTDPRTVNERTLPEKLVAGIYYSSVVDDMGYSDCEATVAADDATIGTPAIVREVLRAPFELWGLRRISMKIDAGNAKALRQAQLLGFRVEGRLREMAPASPENPAGTVLLLGLLPAECPLWQRGIADAEPQA